MNIVLTQTQYADCMWNLFCNAPEGTRFLLRGNGVYLMQTAAHKLKTLNGVFALAEDVEQRGLTPTAQVTLCVLTTWLNSTSRDTPWATF